jgi:hypothetical protein
MFQVMHRDVAHAKRNGQMAKEDPQHGLIEIVQKMQAPFMVDGASGAPVARFLEIQGSLLKEAEVFARHGFQRRNDAIETAMDALRQMNSDGAAGPAGALQVMAGWQRGLLERLGAGAQEWTALFCMRSAAAATTTEVGDTPVGSGKPETDKADGKAGAKPRVGRATPV